MANEQKRRQVVAILALTRVITHMPVWAKRRQDGHVRCKGRRWGAVNPRLPEGVRLPLHGLPSAGSGGLTAGQRRHTPSSTCSPISRRFLFWTSWLGHRQHPRPSPAPHPSTNAAWVATVSCIWKKYLSHAPGTRVSTNVTLPRNREKRRKEKKERKKKRLP